MHPAHGYFNRLLSVRGERWEWATCLLAGSLFLARCVYFGLADLYPEEAYYWNYARHLDIGYLDHPPMVAWLIYLGIKVFPDTEFGVRVLAVVSSLATSFFAFRLANLLYDRRAAWTSVLLVQALPFFFMSGFMMTPDAPLTACWAGSLYFLARVIFAHDARAWLALGVCVGLGMLSKYTIALLGPATFLFLCMDRRSRFWWRRLPPYAGGLIAATFFVPVIVWNARHHWASFAFQSVGRVAESRHFSTLELLGSVLIVLTPVGVVLAGRGLLAPQRIGGSRDASADRQHLLFVRIFTLVPLAVFVLFSFTHRIKLNWTGPLWLALVPAMAAEITALANRPRSMLVYAWRLTLAVVLISYPAFLHYLSWGLPGVGYATNTELLPIGWSELGRALEEKKAAAAASSKRTLIVGLDRNFIASEAAFYQADRERSIRETTGSHLFDGRSLMYKFWFPVEEARGATLLLVSFVRGDLDRRLIHERCAMLGPIEENWLARGGKVIRPFYTRLATDYQPPRRVDPH